MFYKYHNHHCLRIVAKGSVLSCCGLPTQLLSIPSILSAILGILVVIIGFFINTPIVMGYGVMMMLEFVGYYTFVIANFGIRGFYKILRCP